MAKKSLPGFLKPVVDAVTPAAAGLAAVGAGAVAAQVGGAIAKAASPAVDAFAAKSAMHEAAVDGVAGGAVDVGLTAAVGMWKGAAAAAAAAPLLLIGTAVSSLAPAVAPKFAQLADKAVGLLFPSRAPTTPGGYVDNRDLGGLLPPPGGVEALGSVMPGGVDGVSAVDSFGITMV